ncbi:MSP domain protein [Teladorsagia circumcincta]|uniref:Major sperm protein n=1 Tax=Teladorsagia circumcincta TaxID=45464 RepID=A0A2G9UP80_TELCI|nr:MSP domain protein [Teladorsagia circumcincta]
MEDGMAVAGAGVEQLNEAQPASLASPASLAGPALASPASLQGRGGRSLGGRGERGSRLDQVVASLVVAREAGAARAGEEDQSRRNRRVADLGNPGGLGSLNAVVGVGGGRAEGASLLDLPRARAEGANRNENLVLAGRSRAGALGLAGFMLPKPKPCQSIRVELASGTSLPAKPSELRVEPCELSYKAIGGLKGVNVVNDTQERKFFKVKCSDNMLYRVNPVFGVVEPGKSSRIDILRQNGGAKIDKIVLVTTKAEDGETPSREVFNQGRNTEMMVLPLLVQE